MRCSPTKDMRLGEQPGIIHTVMSRLLFKWTDNALIAANTGRPFTHGGLEALCSSHLSDKVNSDQHRFGTETEAKEAVDRIRERELRVYRDSSSRVIQDARLEAEMGRDYTNRLLLELMQNADDAAATERIGYKGLGFKSVLDVCESSRIYSGSLRVRFDRGESRRALQENGLSHLNEVPVLRLPFWNGEMGGNDEADALLKKYDTVIVLPWKGGCVPDAFRREWESVSGDASVLLLLHALREVVWESSRGGQIVWQRNGSGQIEMSVQVGQHVRPLSRWRVFREQHEQSRSAIAIPLDADGKLHPHVHDKVRVFFPTEEESPLPMVLHGEFDLEQNRKHVRPGGTREEIVQSLARCVKLALTEITDNGCFLDLLLPRTPPENMTGLERDVWNAVSTLVREMVLPQSKVKVCEARLCPQANAQDFPWRSDQRLNNWKTFKELLARHRAGGLAGLNFLLPGTDTEEREGVARVLNAAAHLTVQDLRQFALFAVAGRDTPASALDCHLFFPTEGISPPADLPGVRIAFLREEFAAECKKHAPVRTLLEKLGVAEFNPPNIAAALANSSLDGIPEDPLWQFLLSTVGPMMKDENAVMDWKDKHREFLAKHVKVPCRDSAWQVAVNVYAGQDWTENDFLERDPQRYFLSAPPVDEEQRKHFDRLARWLGVGWSPKILPLRDNDGNPLSYADTSGTKDGVRWSQGAFYISQPPKRWWEHCAQMNKDGENEARKARLRQDWMIDGDEDVLRIPVAFESIVSEWKAYGEYLNAVVYRSSNMAHDYDNQQLWPRPSSYVSHLFKQIEWIPVREATQLKAAQDVFAGDCEVHRELPGLVFSPATPVNAEVAKGIGIRREWLEVTKADWQRWLKGSLDLSPQGNPDHQKLVITLYQQALRHFGDRYDDRNQRLWDGEMWCIEKLQDNTAVWHREADHRKIYYVDRPDLARLRLEMLRTFPAELGWLEEKAGQLFRIPRLSEHLRGEPVFTNGDTGELTDRLCERLQDRVNCLAAYLKVKGKDPLQPQQSWQELKFYAGHSLQVSFSLNGQSSQTRSAPAFFEPGTDQVPAALWLDAMENFADAGQPRDIAWEEVGAALCYAAGLSLEDGAVFAGLLGCGEDSLRRKLLNLGVTESDVTNALLRSPVPPLPTSALVATPVVPPVPGGGHRPAGAGGGDGGGGGHGGGGGGGENRAHRELKDKLWEHPELIEMGMQSFRYEPGLASHYRPDLILKDVQGRLVTVEVESEFPGESDFGVWQAVAYKHVVAAEFKLPCDQVRGILVAPRIPSRIKQQCSDLGIEPVEIQLPSF